MTGCARWYPGDPKPADVCLAQVEPPSEEVNTVRSSPSRPVSTTRGPSPAMPERLSAPEPENGPDCAAVQIRPSADDHRAPSVWPLPAAVAATSTPVGVDTQSHPICRPAPPSTAAPGPVARSHRTPSADVQAHASCSPVTVSV